MKAVTVWSLMGPLFASTIGVAATLTSSLSPSTSNPNVDSPSSPTSTAAATSTVLSPGATDTSTGTSTGTSTDTSTGTSTGSSIASAATGTSVTGTSTTPTATPTITSSAIPSSTGSSLSSSATITSSGLCSACGYRYWTTDVTYPGPSISISTTTYTATELTFTLLYPNGSSTVSYSLVGNYTPSLNVTQAFVTPTTVGTFSPPPVWTTLGATLTAGIDYVMITAFGATSYSSDIIPAQTAVPGRVLKRPLILPRGSPASASTNCDLASTVDLITDVAPYPVSTSMQSMDSAVSQASREFFDMSDVQQVFGVDPGCTIMPDFDAFPTGGHEIPQIASHRPPQPPPPAATNGPNLLTATPGQLAPSVYVSVSVLINNGPATVLTVAPTGGGPSAPVERPGTGGSQGPTPVPGAPQPGNPQPGNPGPQVTPGPVVVIQGGNTITQAPGGTGIIVNGGTVPPGQTATLPNGDPISVGSGGTIVVNGQTTVLPNPGVPAAPSVVVVPGGGTITQAPGGTGIIVNGQTIAPGQTATLANGAPISVGSGGTVVVNGQTTILPNPAAPPPVTVGGLPVQQLPGGTVIVNGQTFTPGQSTTLANGETVSVGTGGVVVVGGHTATAPPPLITGAPPVTVGGATVTPLPGGTVVISGTTLAPGATTTLPNGEIVTVLPGGGGVVVNGQTATLPNVPASATPIIIGGETVTPLPNGGVGIDGTTLTPGQAITLPDSQVISVGTGGIVVVGSTTAHIPTGTSSSKRSSTSKHTTTTSSTSLRAFDVGTAVATGIGATKKGDANALMLGRDAYVGLDFGILLGFIGFLAGL